MKKYLAGLLTGLLSVAVITTALAATDLVSFNLSAIKFNGEIISAAGEGYTLSNGCVAPASITYTDEQGGGTTYLPARRVSELMDVDIGWDPATGAVTIGKVEHPAAPDTAANVSDYSDWSAEDEAAYQEFKGMWEVSGKSIFDEGLREYAEIYDLVCKSNLNDKEIYAIKIDAESKGFLDRLCRELRKEYTTVHLRFYADSSNKDDLAIGYYSLREI